MFFTFTLRGLEDRLMVCADGGDCTRKRLSERAGFKDRCVCVSPRPHDLIGPAAVRVLEAETAAGFSAFGPQKLGGHISYMVAREFVRPCATSPLAFPLRTRTGEAVFQNPCERF